MEALSAGNLHALKDPELENNKSRAAVERVHGTIASSRRLPGQSHCKVRARHVVNFNSFFCKRHRVVCTMCNFIDFFVALGNAMRPRPRLQVPHLCFLPCATKALKSSHGEFLARISKHGFHGSETIALLNKMPIKF